MIGLGSGRAFPSRLAFVADETAVVEAMMHVTGESITPSPDGMVLLVEDNSGISDVVQALLEDEGFAVAAIGDGRAAVAWTEQHRPALVVLDLDLPVIDGVTVGSLLRARFGALLPILIFSADQRAYVRTRHLGPCGLVRKPFDSDVLVAAVRRGLDGSSSIETTGALPSGQRAPLRAPGDAGPGP